MVTLSEWRSCAPEANGLRMTDGEWPACAITYDAMYRKTSIHDFQMDEVQTMPGSQRSDLFGRQMPKLFRFRRFTQQALVSLIEWGE